ncbi:MAG: hypothetical protein EBW20_11440 [Betaproteobacteria bacterium]|nr:hypothetical protein [Betaproteobacteria bacterium]
MFDEPNQAMGLGLATCCARRNACWARLKRCRSRSDLSAWLAPDQFARNDKKTAFFADLLRATR